MSEAKELKNLDIASEIQTIKPYGFIHSHDKSKIIAAKGLGNWIDRYKAIAIAEKADYEIHILQTDSSEKDKLIAELTSREKGESNGYR